MNLQAQIGLITVPQEFSRLCNAVLSAEHGDDFLAIDDDRPDRGNDVYLKSEKRLFAAHCFKRIQNQRLDSEIRSKMLSDLGKAITLKAEGPWQIDSWTFLCNYPISEAIAAQVVKVGNEADIAVSWRGPDYLAAGLQRHADVRSQFPDLEVSVITEQLATLQGQVAAVAESARAVNGAEDRLGIPETPDDERDLLLKRPGGWEYLLFAGILKRGKQNLELKWRDHELQLTRAKRVHLGESEAISYLRNTFGDLASLCGSLTMVFQPELQETVFGAPGEPGDPVRIEHLARHIVTTYEEMLDWAAAVRATVVSDTLSPLFQRAARLVDRPASDIRNFIDKSVAEKAKSLTIWRIPTRTNRYWRLS